MSANTNITTLPALIKRERERQKLKRTAPPFPPNIVLRSSQGQELDTGFEWKPVKQDFFALWTNGWPTSGILNNYCCSLLPGEVYLSQKALMALT